MIATIRSVKIEGSRAGITFCTPDFMYENQWCWYLSSQIRKHSCQRLHLPTQSNTKICVTYFSLPNNQFYGDINFKFKLILTLRSVIFPFFDFTAGTEAREKGDSSGHSRLQIIHPLGLQHPWTSFWFHKPLNWRSQISPKKC